MDMTGAVKDQAQAAIAAMSPSAQPVARGGQPDDISNMVAFLASDEASFITGQHFVVDGGLTSGERHSWDPNTPGLFAALEAMEKAGTTQAPA
jgi:NAD(P)-dependent dehydrogenase (short-subunit alcohol dehydrogenase family)